MTSSDIRIVSPCGILGYGFPEESFNRAFENDQEIHGIVVDAGSTDAGPHKLGAGVAIVSRRATKRIWISSLKMVYHGNSHCYRICWRSRCQAAYGMDAGYY